MKRNLFFILLATAMLFACKKDTKLTYNSPDNIYLNYLDKNGNQDTTSLTYSFAYTQGVVRDTIWLPVILSGKHADHDRKFAIDVVDLATTAISGLHYEPLKSFYILPKDSGTVRVPLILKNTDAALMNKSVSLTVRVSGGEDFKTNLPVSVRTKEIIFSNRLEEPIWWKFWAQLGTYSRVKHQLFLISSGTTDLIDPSQPDAYLQIPRVLYYLENTRVFLTYPFDWVKENPQKGYVLTQRNDGTGDYDFYNTSTPTVKFYLKFFSQAGVYVFIDENGNQVTM
ncbi:DUF4843 domain-containing protein [Pedobacter sp. L105]|uniref:DUF4843 domain-containing protein n=1 Tax=Pedobacter sp. L105 TaxID=1641871 RepID=UPI00131B385E|nr:DUF4843 domain-containing protein [Pedobacter sp. L105]